MPYPVDRYGPRDQGPAPAELLLDGLEEDPEGILGAVGYGTDEEGGPYYPPAIKKPPRRAVPFFLPFLEHLRLF